MKKITCLIILISWIYGCQTDTYEKVSGEYYFYEEGLHQTVIIKDGLDYHDKLIPCEILSYDYNNDYIIAAQKPLLPCFIGKFAGTIQYPVSKDSVYYWIISVKQDLVTGPLTKKDFEAKRVELKVPDDLKLKLR